MQSNSEQAMGMKQLWKSHICNRSVILATGSPGNSHHIQTLFPTSPSFSLLPFFPLPPSSPLARARFKAISPAASTELKTLVDLHGNEAGKGGELTHDETTVIAGALELTEKTVSDAMTLMDETFLIDINAKLDRSLMNIIFEKGHSRVPIFYEHSTNNIRLVLVKNLLIVHPKDELPVKSVTIRKIPRVPETMPLYDILSEFQKGHNHMAVDIKQQSKPTIPPTPDSVKDVRVDIDGEK